MYKPFYLNFNYFTSLPWKQPNTSTYASIGGIAGNQNILANTGNVYTSYALLKLTHPQDQPIEGISNIFNFEITSQLVSYINTSNFSHIIIILQDHIRASFSDLKFAKISTLLNQVRSDIQLVVFGLGVNGFEPSSINDIITGLSDDQKHFFNLISQRSHQIGVRGYLSQEILSKLKIHNVSPIGCPTYFEEGPNRKVPEIIPTRSKVLYTGIPPFSKKDNFTLMLQDEIDLTSQNQYTIYPSYLSSILLNALSHDDIAMFFSIPDWKHFIKSQAYAFSFGSRVHGSIISLNSGLPALVTNPDFRAKEMCELFKIPHIKNYPNITHEDDITKELQVSELNRTYPGLFEKFTQFLSQQNIPLNTDVPFSNPKPQISIHPNILPKTNLSKKILTQTLLNYKKQKKLGWKKGKKLISALIKHYTSASKNARNDATT